MLCQRGRHRTAARQPGLRGARSARAVRLCPSGAVLRADRRAVSPRRSGCRRRAARLEACVDPRDRGARPARSAGQREPIPSSAPSPRRWTAAAGCGRRRCWRPCPRPSPARPASAGGLAGVDAARRMGRERAPGPAPGNEPVRPDEARSRLAQLLGVDAEPRPQQADYAAAVSRRLRAARRAPTSPMRSSPRPGPGSARPSAISRRRACGPRRTSGSVWISTFTRNLQTQIAGELDRLYPDPDDKAPPRRRPQGPGELSVPA